MTGNRTATNLLASPLSYRTYRLPSRKVLRSHDNFRVSGRGIIYSSLPTVAKAATYMSSEQQPKPSYVPFYTIPCGMPRPSEHRASRTLAGEMPGSLTTRTPAAPTVAQIHTMCHAVSHTRRRKHSQPPALAGIPPLPPHHQPSTPRRPYAGGCT